jgi:hypothetical protein
MYVSSLLNFDGDKFQLICVMSYSSHGCSGKLHPSTLKND